jgi:hypothetical protein
MQHQSEVRNSVNVKLVERDSSDDSRGKRLILAVADDSSCGAENIPFFMDKCSKCRVGVRRESN